MKRALLGLVLSLACSGHADAATFQVTNTNDSGAGSLRECMQVVNANPPGPHRIVFAIPGSGVMTIELQSDLPALTTTVSIDGTSQPGYNGMPLIEINGNTNIGPIFLNAPNSSVKGLALNRFAENVLFVAADVCTVSSCFIGTDATGTATSSNGNAAIYVTGKRALIGGRIPAYRNILSGNQVGVWLTAEAGQDTVIGNFIGTDVTGTVDIPNGFTGVQVSNAPGVVIDNNLISGNTIYGIYLNCETSFQPGEGTRIYRNLIGTDVSGRFAIPNLAMGVYVTCDYTIVGRIGGGNVISGNGEGVTVEGDHCSYNEIRGNKIGVSSDGTRPLGNTLTGIQLFQSHDNVIGGSQADGSGNQVAANGTAGIGIFGTTATDNIIQGNAIGTSFNGALLLGNGDEGLRLQSDRTTVGGLGPLGNIIAYNDAGVAIEGVQCPIRGNSIFSNSFGLGIDLGIISPGLTPNDSLDEDDGANHLQNHPMLAAVSLVGNQVRLQGHLSSVPNRTYTVDFYSNRQCGVADVGEGESWFGSTNVVTSPAGLGLFDVQFPVSSAVGYVFTSTATDDAGSTSEFSPCAPLGTQPTTIDPGAGMVFALGAASPSPARGRTSLPFSLARPSRVTIRVYDVAGRLVRTLLDRELPAGPNRVDWTLSGLGAGVYSCRLDARAADGSPERFQASRSVIILP